jgi:hypothetical protein
VHGRCRARACVLDASEHLCRAAAEHADGLDQCSQYWSDMVVGPVVFWIRRTGGCGRGCCCQCVGAPSSAGRGVENASASAPCRAALWQWRMSCCPSQTPMLPVCVHAPGSCGCGCSCFARRASSQQCAHTLHCLAQRGGVPVRQPEPAADSSMSHAPVTHAQGGAHRNSLSDAGRVAANGKCGLIRAPKAAAWPGMLRAEPTAGATNHTHCASTLIYLPTSYRLQR